MIICVSANPAVDRRVRVKNLKIGAVNRASASESWAGGKAAHAAMAARALGEHVVWIGFLGGASGAQVERQLGKLGIEVLPVRTMAPTRTNDEIIDENGRITEILEPGGNISQSEIGHLYDVCHKVFAQSGANFQTVFSGSLPPGVPVYFYPDLIRFVREKGGKTILDTSGAALLHALSAMPDLIKPNLEEAENVLNVKIEDEKTAVSAAKQLQMKGAQTVALSLGAAGFLWLEKGKDAAVMATTPHIEALSTVGCGDAAVAGLAIGSRCGWDATETLRLAAACGAANCLADLPGQIKVRDVERLLSTVKLKTLAVNAKEEFAGS